MTRFELTTIFMMVIKLIRFHQWTFPPGKLEVNARNCKNSDHMMTGCLQMAIKTNWLQSAQNIIMCPQGCVILKMGFVCCNFDWLFK